VTAVDRLALHTYTLRVQLHKLLRVVAAKVSVYRVKYSIKSCLQVLCIVLVYSEGIVVRSVHIFARSNYIQGESPIVFQMK